ncbi:hypothetical protein [Streptomyces sp. CBG31]|uniref:hypothetical protein n=1 Tax=Streptomyces sp. CBG31 TaxID=2762623 RepID=UPI001EFEE68E|nr:hypothetical protein [Streptomyces sp. CBG31]
MTRGRPGLAGPGLPAWGQAFPARLAEDVRRAAAFVPESRPGPAEPFRVVVTGESVDIPSRVYDEEPGECPGPGLTGTQRLILHCLYSRHHDGHVRQRHLEALLPAAEPWVVPYVIQQAGEYVREIQEAIRRGLPGIAVPHSPQRRLYGAFIVRNAEFFARTERRAVSYWACYHRAEYPVFGASPGGVLMAEFRAAATECAGTAWPRHTPRPVAAALTPPAAAAARPPSPGSRP